LWIEATLHSARSRPPASSNTAGAKAAHGHKLVTAELLPNHTLNLAPEMTEVEDQRAAVFVATGKK